MPTAAGFHREPGGQPPEIVEGFGHRRRSEQRDGWNGDDRKDRERLDAVVGRQRHARSRAGEESDPGQAREHLRDGQGEHGDADAEPAHLRHAQQQRRQDGALLPERPAGEEVRGKAGLGGDVRQEARVDAQQQVARQHRQQEGRGAQSVAQSGPRPHAGRKERESQHDDQQRRKTPAVGGGDGGKLVFGMHGAEIWPVHGDFSIPNGWPACVRSRNAAGCGGLFNRPHPVRLCGIVCGPGPAVG